MTPELYRQNGFETKIGPLVMIRSVNGNPLLVVRDVGVNAAGRPRRARSLEKNGQPRKGQRLKSFVVAFKRRHKWNCFISIDGRNRYLGGFDTIEEAAKARREAQRTAGYSQNHGSEPEPPSP